MKTNHKRGLGALALLAAFLIAAANMGGCGNKADDDAVVSPPPGPTAVVTPAPAGNPPPADQAPPAPPADPKVVPESAKAADLGFTEIKSVEENAEATPPVDASLTAVFPGGTLRLPVTLPSGKGSFNWELQGSAIGRKQEADKRRPERFRVFSVSGVAAEETAIRAAFKSLGLDVMANDGNVWWTLSDNGETRSKAQALQVPSTEKDKPASYLVVILKTGNRDKDGQIDESLASLAVSTPEPAKEEPATPADDE